MPASSTPNGAPGALEAEAPEFLDFLLSQSAADRQQLYRNGLDGLNSQAKKRFSKLFADVDAGQADTLLAPLRDPWTYDAPSDPVAAMLRAAKDDVRRATRIRANGTWRPQRDELAVAAGACTGCRSIEEPMAETKYDVLIIGSGASGGMAAYTLTKKGIKCLMLDAGPAIDFERQRVNKAAYELPFRGFGKPGRLVARISGDRIQREPVGG